MTERSRADLAQALTDALDAVEKVEDAASRARRPAPRPGVDRADPTGVLVDPAACDPHVPLNIEGPQPECRRSVAA